MYRLVIGRLISVGFVGGALFVAYSFGAHFYRGIQLKPLPRLVYEGRPKTFTDADWWGDSLTHPRSLLFNGQTYPLKSPWRQVQVLIVLGGPLWLLMRQKASKTQHREMPYVPFVNQVKELRKLDNYPLLEESCEETLREYGGFLPKKDRIAVLEALAFSKRMRGMGQDAVTGYRKILAEEADNKEAQIGLLLAYSISERNLPGPGAELLTKAIRELRPFPDDLVRFYLEQTLKPAKRGSTPVALPAPSGLIRSLPGSDTLRPQLQMVLNDLATKPGPCQPRAALCLAEMSVGEGKPKLAVPNLKTALTSDPRLDEAYALAMETFNAAGQLPDLHRLLSNLLSQDSKNVLAQNAMNQLYERFPEITGKVGANPMKEPKEQDVSPTIRTSAAAPAVEPDGSIDPGLSPDDRFAMAVDALKQGKAQVARSLFEDLSQKKFPRMDTLRALLAMACLKLKDNDGARSQVDRIQWGKLPAQEIYPLARMLETSGQLEQAKAVYKRLLEEYPDYKDVKDRLKLIEREMTS